MLNTKPQVDFSEPAYYYAEIEFHTDDKGGEDLIVSLLELLDFAIDYHVIEIQTHIADLLESELSFCPIFFD